LLLSCDGKVLRGEPRRSGKALTPRELREALNNAGGNRRLKPRSNDRTARGPHNQTRDWRDLE